MMSVSPSTSTERVGGVSLYVTSLSQELFERGHRIAILTNPTSCPPMPLPGVDATFLLKPLLAPVVNKLLQIDPTVYIATRRFLKVWRPDILHLHHFIPISVAPIMAAAHVRVPVVVTLHSYWPVCLRHQLCQNEDLSCQQRYSRNVCSPCLARGLRERIGLQVPAPLISMVLLGVWPARQRLLQNVGRFIAPSPAVAQSLRESGYPTERIVIVPHGLPPGDDLVRPRKPRLRPRGGHLLYAGRLVSHKGVQYLLKALHQVRQVHPELVLTLAGDGPFRPQLERLAASLGLSEVARFIGVQSRSRLFELYAEADLIVVPSLSESFCYVALEGAVAGVPIVATNVGGIPDVLGDAALLVPPMDPAALARGILTLLSDYTTATANAKRIRERAVARFGFKTMVDRTESLYSELLDA